MSVQLESVSYTSGDGSDDDPIGPGHPGHGRAVSGGADPPRGGGAR